jgi:hypothetical protein
MRLVLQSCAQAAVVLRPGMTQVGFGISVGDPGELRIQRLSAENYAIFVSWRCLLRLTLSGIVSGASIHMASSHKATVYII